MTNSLQESIVRPPRLALVSRLDENELATEKTGRLENSSWFSDTEQKIKETLILSNTRLKDEF